jgi:hypothetical protein
MDTLRIVDTVPLPVIEHDTVRVYDFQGSDGPFDFMGQGRIMPAGQGIFDVSVGMNRAIQVGALVSCGSEDGVRSAHVLLTAEDPFHVIPMAVEQDRGVCNPFRPSLFHFETGKAVWGGVGFVAGILIAHLTDDGFRKARY